MLTTWCVCASRRIRDEELGLFSKLPYHIVYRPEEDPRTTDPAKLYVKLVVRLEHLLNVFLTERLIALKLGVVGVNLVASSFEMVVLSVLFWTNKDRLSSFQWDFEWMVCSRTSLPFLNKSAPPLLEAKLLIFAH